MKNLVNEMIKTLEGRNVQELKNEVAAVRKLSAENRSKLMRKEIERSMYEIIEKSINTQIAAYKAVLGNEFPTFEVKAEKVNLKNRDENHIEEMIADLQDDLKTLCKKRIEEMTGKYNARIKELNEEIKALEIEKAELLGEKFEGDFEGFEAAAEEIAAPAEEIKAAAEVVESAAVQAEDLTFNNETNIKVAKKYHAALDCLYKDVEGYRIELKDGYIFSSSECGCELCDTVAEVKERLKYIVKE